MWLEAILTKNDLREVAERFAPLKILLGVSGSLLLACPRDVSLVPDNGIALVCDATIHWPVLGLDVPVSLHGLLVNILPAVEDRGAGATLVFRLRIDHTGVAILPSFFDHSVTARINQELERKQIELAWNFTRTLTHAFGLPTSFASAEFIALRASAGRVKVTDDAIGLAVDFEASVRPRSACPSASRRLPPGQPASVGEAVRPNGASHARSVDTRSIALGAIAGGLLFTTLRTFGGVGKRRTRRWT